MGRLVDENDVYSALTKYYHHKTATQHIALIDALGTAKPVEAIPVEWIEAKMKKLKDMDNGFPCLAADILYGVLMDWRREQENETN